jgi:DNA-binding LytR/AlgR family response regulator
MAACISRVRFLHVVKSCEDPFEAMEVMETEKTDLLFLDINMPEINGFQLLDAIKFRPAVIFTSAFREYALESYMYDCIDFLLKPFEFERFLKAVSKASYVLNKSNGQLVSNLPQNRFIFVKSDYKLVKINVDDIFFVEGLKDYIKIHTRQKLIMTLMSMTAIEQKLPGEEFFRIHRSFIISMNKINFISRHRVVIGDKFIPISLPYREKFYTVIDRAL